MIYVSIHHLRSRGWDKGSLFMYKTLGIYKLAPLNVLQTNIVQNQCKTSIAHKLQKYRIDPPFEINVHFEFPKTKKTKNFRNH